MSTLDQADVTIMKSNPAFSGAEIFQYDYLNDDITDFGEINYNLSNKVPFALRQAIADEPVGKKAAKPILVLINPPYAEATGGGLAVPMAVSENKLGIASTLFARASMAAYGKATNELFMQFIARVDQEIPRCKLAIFSKVKYISTLTLDKFRQVWKAKYLGGFAVHSRSFDGLKGDFPIGFLIWDTSKDVPVDHAAGVAGVSSHAMFWSMNGGGTPMRAGGGKWIVRDYIVPRLGEVAPIQKLGCCRLEGSGA